MEKELPTREDDRVDAAGKDELSADQFAILAQRKEIGHLDDARELLDGKKGTVVAPTTEAMTMQPFKTQS